MSRAWVKGKVVFVGDASVGKTCIIASQNNLDQNYVQPTVAAASIATKVDLDGVEVKLNVWDTAGQDDYRCLVPMYAHFSQVAVIVFSVTEKSSFDSIPEWLKFLKSNAEIPHIFLVANKVDLEPEVDEQAITQVAETHNLKLFHTSAVTGENIDSLFYEIARVVEYQSAVTNEAEVNVVQFEEAIQAERTKRKCPC